MILAIKVSTYVAHMDTDAIANSLALPLYPAVPRASKLLPCTKTAASAIISKTPILSLITWPLVQLKQPMQLDRKDSPKKQQRARAALTKSPVVFMADSSRATTARSLSVWERKGTGRSGNI